MENEERKEELEEKVKVVEGTIISGNTNSEEDVKKDSKANDKRGLCIAALVLGIIALVFSCVYMISIPCGLLALIFGIIGVKSETKGMAIAGIIMGVISLIIGAILFIMIFAIGMSSSILDEIYDNYNYDTSYHHYSRNYDV